MSETPDYVYGLPLEKKIPDGVVVSDALVIAKVLLPDGKIKVVATCTHSLTNIEAYGMTELAASLLRRSLENHG
jgi:hypothetical protein